MINNNVSIKIEEIEGHNDFLMMMAEDFCESFDIKNDCNIDFICNKDYGCWCEGRLDGSYIYNEIELDEDDLTDCVVRLVGKNKEGLILMTEDEKKKRDQIIKCFGF